MCLCGRLGGELADIERGNEGGKGSERPSQGESPRKLTNPKKHLSSIKDRLLKNIYRYKFSLCSHLTLSQGFFRDVALMCGE